MSKEKPEIIKITTPEFRVSYPAVFEPSGLPGQEKKYSVAMLFDKKTDISALKAAIKQCVTAKYPDPSKRPSNFKICLRDGDKDKADKPEYAGCMFATARSTQRPGLVDASVQPILNKEEFYAGCYARATVSVFCYDNVGVGVGLGLQNIQKLRDGEPLSSRSRAEDDFGSVESANKDDKSSATPASNDDMFS